MSAKYGKLAIGFCAAFAITSGPLALAPAIASKPLPRKIAGCVFGGNLISLDGYEIRPKGVRGQPIELRKFESRELTIDGDLLPGDVLIVNKGPRDAGRFKIMRPAEKLRRAEC